MKPLATATYQDIWFGPIKAELTPFKTTRGAVRVIAYRWVTERGAPVGTAQTNPSILVSWAVRNDGLFSDVASPLASRDTWEGFKGRMRQH